MSLISDKFGADLNDISKITCDKTKWLRFFGLPGILCTVDLPYSVYTEGHQLHNRAALAKRNKKSKAVVTREEAGTKATSVCASSF